MNSEKIIEFIDKLIGDIEPYGSSHIDHEREKNLIEYCYVALTMIERICEVSKNKDSYLMSLSSIGGKAYQQLIDIRYLINEYIGDEESGE